MKFAISALLGLVSADQFLVAPISNPFELMALQQAQNDALLLQMLSQDLAL